MKDIKKNIVTKAAARFQQETGLPLTVIITEDNAEILLRYKDYDLKFDALIVDFINKEQLGIVKNRLNELKNIPVLVTIFAYAELAENLRELEINFIDTAGNIFINVPPLYIYIKGNRKPEVKTKIVPQKRPRLVPANKNNLIATNFPPAALQMIFTLLCNPDLVKNTYREIADMANIALGTVNNTFRLLEKRGFLVRVNDAKKIVNKDKLLQLWINDYPLNLKPKYLFDRFQFENAENIDDIDLKYYNALWGGETAAAIITNYLRPYIHTVYINDKFGEFILRNRLKRNPNGNFLIYRKFWNFDDEYTPRDIAPAILIYADLMITGDNRNIETANLIYRNEIAQHFK